MRQTRIAAHAVCTDDDRAGGVERAGGNFVARLFGYGQVFTGQHGFVGFAFTCQDAAVGRYHFTRPHQQHVAALKLHHGGFFSRFVDRIVRQFAAEGRYEFDQSFRRIPCFAPCGLLHKTPQRKQEYQHGQTFEIHSLSCIPQQGVQAGTESQPNG